MLIDSNNSFYICSVECASVNLRSQLRIKNPSGACRHNTNREGLFLSDGLQCAEEPGIGQTWNLCSLDRANSVLGSRKPRRSNLIFRYFSFLFSLTFLLELVSFPFFFSLKISLIHYYYESNYTVQSYK